MTHIDSRLMWKINPGHSSDDLSHSYKEMTRSERAADWVAVGYISVGFGDITEDLYGRSWEAIKQACLEQGRSVSEASCLNMFLNTMRPGHLVVFRTASTDTEVGKIWIGRVGAYHRAATDHRHRRHVRWFEPLVRDKADRDMERATFLRGTLASIKGRASGEGNADFYSTVVDRFALRDDFIAPPRALGRIAQPVRSDYVPNSGPPPIAGAPEATVTATNLHNKTQNNLLSWLQSKFGKEAVQTFDRALGWNADVDLLLEEDERITIIEVKSIQDGNDLDQLRSGLGQTLDYIDRYRSDDRDVSGVLWLSSEPKDSARWQQLCDRYDIRLGWPGREHEVFQR